MIKKSHNQPLCKKLFDNNANNKKIKLIKSLMSIKFIHLFNKI